jgi:hypothetical protein
MKKLALALLGILLMSCAVAPLVSAQTVCIYYSSSQLASLVKGYFPSGTTNSGENIRVVAYAVACAESSKYICAKGDNGNSIGLWQINVLYHPEYSKYALTSPTYNAQAACKISSNGKNWGQWSTYNNGRYKSFIPEAKKYLGV